MFKVSRKEAVRGSKKILKYAVILYIGYWVVDLKVQWDEAAEHRAIVHKREKECSAKLAGMEQVPILGGSYLDRTRIPGFFYGSSSKSDGTCIADILEGAFWWTGTEMRTALEQSGKEAPADWGHFKLTARLYTRKETTEPHNMGYRHTDWPDDLIVKLKNYPGLELWLNAPPPHFKNESSIKNFVMRDWRRRDGTPRLIKCDGLKSREPDILASGLGVSSLMLLDKEQLENLNFGSLRVFCMVELHSFDFAGGDGRVYLGTEGLRWAPEALKFVSDHLSRSVIKGI